MTFPPTDGHGTSGDENAAPSEGNAAAPGRTPDAADSAGDGASPASPYGPQAGRAATTGGDPAPAAGATDAGTPADAGAPADPGVPADPGAGAHPAAGWAPNDQRPTPGHAGPGMVMTGPGEFRPLRPDVPDGFAPAAPAGSGAGYGGAPAGPPGAGGAGGAGGGGWAGDASVPGNAGAPGGPGWPGAASAGGAADRPSRGLGGIAIAALALGGAALLVAMIPWAAIGALVLALAGIVAGILAIRNRATGGMGMAVAGIVASGCALLIAVPAFAFGPGGIVRPGEDAPLGDGYSSDGGVDGGDDAWDDADGLGDIDGWGAADGLDESSSDAPAPPLEGDTNGPKPLAPEDIPVPDEGISATPESPAPYGSTVVIPDWDNDAAWNVRLDRPKPAGDLVENELPENAIEGVDYNWYVVRVTTQNKTGNPQPPWIGMRITYVAADGTIGVPGDLPVQVPDSFFDVRSIANGAAVESNLVVGIPSGMEDGGRWIVSSRDFATQRYFGD